MRCCEEAVLNRSPQTKLETGRSGLRSLSVQRVGLMAGEKGRGIEFRGMRSVG